MVDSRWLVAVVLVVLTVVTATAPVAGGGGDQSTDHLEASNQSVSEFIHSSSTATERSLESELVDAAIENASAEERTEIIDNRTDELKDRLDRLETDQAALDDTALSTPEQQTQAIQLSAELDSLERSIDRVEAHANETGVEDQRLPELRSDVADLEQT